jgi:NADH dehydrogenase (ubiquinone) Fe-S protein 2
MHALRRELARAPGRFARRALSTTPRVASVPAQDRVAGTGKFGARYAMDTHTVEDLQGLSAAEILAEHDGRREKQMRHFTGACASCAMRRNADGGLK